MGAKERIATIRLINKMENNKIYSEKLGIVDNSTFHGVRVDKIERGHSIQKSVPPS